MKDTEKSLSWDASSSSASLEFSCLLLTKKIRSHVHNSPQIFQSWARWIQLTSSQTVFLSSI
jgi:hypothetical protein